MSTSGVSTVNSAKQTTTKSKKIADNKFAEEITGLKVENVRLLQELLESQKIYQSLLKSTIDEQHLNLNVLKNFTQQLSTASNLYHRSLSQGYFSDASCEHHRMSTDDQSSISPTPPPLSINNNLPTTTLHGATANEVDGCGVGAPLNRRPISTKPNHIRSDSVRSMSIGNRRIHDPFSRGNVTTSIDIRLNDWLIKHSVDLISRTMIFHEEFTYEDFVYDLDKHDLHRIGLK